MEQTSEKNQEAIYQVNNEHVEYLLDNPTQKFHPLDGLFDEYQFKPLIPPGLSFLIFDTSKQGEKNEDLSNTVLPTSHVRLRIFSRIERGNLLFEEGSQQGQERKFKLRGQEVKTIKFLHPLILKMSVGQIGVVKCEFQEHKQILKYKDEDNKVQTVPNSSILYFIYLDQEIKAGVSPGQTQPQQNSLQFSRQNFDDFMLQKEQAK